tara:strand:+ start:2838 stop:3569 length:732 start_codon:yes stop_codon:yes gene_type:complete
LEILTIQKILDQKKHRPWNFPNKNWRFYQEWNNAIFLHFKVEIEELKQYVPKELEIDLFDGEPWVSVVAFTMEKIRPKYIPAFPPISNFHEINIRTYVKLNNKTGVYFLSIEGGSKLSCKIAKFISDLPYRYSNIERSNTYYKSNNSNFNDELYFEFEIGKQIELKTKLDNWLTERYALFQDAKKYINQYEIHHLPWLVYDVNLNNLKCNYPKFNNLLKKEPVKIQYSKGVQVIAWGKNKIKK